MSLRKVGHYNDISPELLPKMPEQGTVVFFRSLQETTNPIPDKNTGRREVTYPLQVKIHNFSKFYDWKKGEWIEIGVGFNTVNQSGQPQNVRRHWAYPQTNGGCYSITIGQSAETDAMYQFLMLASFVQVQDRDPEYQRDESEEMLFEHVDYLMEATNKRKQRDLKVDAIIAARELTGDNLQRFAILARKYNKDTPEGILKEMVEDYAEQHPAQFMKILNDESGDAKATVLHGLNLGILIVEESALRWADSRAEIMSLSRPNDPEIEFANYVRTDPNGAKMLAIIKDIISKKPRDGAGRKTAGKPPKNQ